MDDPTPVAVSTAPSKEEAGRHSWHLVDEARMPVRTSPETYPSAEEARRAGDRALADFGAAADPGSQRRPQA